MVGIAPLSIASGLEMGGVQLSGLPDAKPLGPVVLELVYRL